MTQETDSTLIFALSRDSGDLEWFYETVEVTTEQAMVIAHARGMNKISSAIEKLADAIYSLADHIPGAGNS